MNKLFPYPFVRLIIPLLAGIIAGAYSNMLYAHLFAPVLVLWLCLFVVLIYPRFSDTFIGRYHYLLYSLAIIFLMGYFLSNNHFRNIHQYTDNGNGDSFLLKVSAMPVEKDKSVKITAEVFNIDNSRYDSSRFCGKGLFYIEKDSLALNIGYGDELVLLMNLTAAKKNENPGEFNYRTYLNRKGIIWRSFVPGGNWLLIKQNTAKGISGAVISYRNQVLLMLKNAELREKELSVAAAMLLGYDEILDRHTKQAFSDAGAMHILCVSGLHVGIIYLVLNNLLLFLKRIRFGNILQVLMILILIWCYAGLTGMQAPVLRASIMFSFLAFGKLINRQAYVYNTLAASAFVILLFQPMALFNAGFQLSYAAVIFIIWLHNPLYRILPYYSKFTGKIWSLICVSIAASIGTLPLVLHYFNQFPLYFILTNLLVVPLSFLIVGSGIVLILFPFFSSLTYLVIKILNVLLQLLNGIVTAIHKLPNSGIDQLYLNVYEIMLLYLLIVFLAAVMVSKKYGMLKYALTALLLLLFSFSHHVILQNRERKIIVYCIGRGTAIDLIEGRKHYLIADSAVVADEYLLDYKIKGYWIKNSLLPVSIYYPDVAGLVAVNDGISYSRNLLVFNNFKLLVLDDKVNPDFFSSMLFDALLIKPGMKISPDSLCKTFNCPVWITHPSVSRYRTEQLKINAESEGITLYEMKKHGAYIHDI